MRQIVLAALALIFAAAPCAAAGGFPLGLWYTEGAERGVQMQILVKDAPDKTFVKSGKSFVDCATFQPILERGTWTFDGRTYGEVTRSVDDEPVDPASPDNIDTFQYTPIDANHVSLFDPKTNITWTFERVTPDFRIPASTHCTS